MDTYICYEWLFSIQVQNRKGRTYRKHLHRTLGDTYNNAKQTLEFDMRRKKWQLNTINEVTLLGIAFAFYRDSPNYLPVPPEAYKNLPKPTIPEVLNYCSPFFSTPNCRVRCTCTQKFYETQL